MSFTARLFLAGRGCLGVSRRVSYSLVDCRLARSPFLTRRVSSQVGVVWVFHGGSLIRWSSVVWSALRFFHGESLPRRSELSGCFTASLFLAGQSESSMCLTARLFLAGRSRHLALAGRNRSLCFIADLFLASLNRPVSSALLFVLANFVVAGRNRRLFVASRNRSVVFTPGLFFANLNRPV